MNLSDSQDFEHGIADVLGHIRKKGVTLWCENGELRYRAPKGALTCEEAERLSATRYELVSFLEKRSREETVEPSLGPRQQLDRAPLAFSQLAHWQLNRLHERPSVRQLACATRLCGHLDLGVFQESLDAVVRRHEALRTRVVTFDGVPAQVVAASSSCPLEVDHLTGLSTEVHETEIQRAIDQLILEPIQVSVGQLCGVRLLRLDDSTHVLIVAMEHMISDALSLNLFLRDLLTIYSQTLRGCTPYLPPIPVQLADFAAWQANRHSAWMARHGSYWSKRLGGCGRVRFPEENRLPMAGLSGWGTVAVNISRDLKAELLEWCRLNRTTLVMAVFTAYVGLVMRWCNAAEIVIRYQTDGRISPRLQHTIGYLASVVHLRMELRGADTFVDLMHQATQEYCNACEHADLSLLDAEVPRPEYAKNGGFNWVPQAPQTDHAKVRTSCDGIVASPIPFENPVLKIYDRDSEPTILFYDTDAGVTGGVHFPLNRFHFATMQRFAGNFMMFIRELVSRPGTPLRDISLK